MEKRKKISSSEGDFVKAMWNEKTHAMFVRICLDQMRLGNRPKHTLNKDGYKNLEAEFFKQTGLRYSKLQFKNHWDATRRDWQAWDELRRSSEMEWDNEKNTYSQTSEWWAAFANKFPGGDKFARQPLQHAAELDILFGGGATGNMELGFAIVLPEQGRIPSEAVGQSQENESIQDDDATSLRQLTSEGTSESQGQPSQNNPMPSTCKKKHQNHTAYRKQDGLNKTHESLSEKNKRLKEEQNPMLKAIKLLNEAVGIERMSDEWLFAASLLRDKINRDLFSALGDPAARGAWIKREYRLSSD